MEGEDYFEISKGGSVRQAQMAAFTDSGADIRRGAVSRAFKVNNVQAGRAGFYETAGKFTGIVSVNGHLTVVALI